METFAVHGIQRFALSFNRTAVIAYTESAGEQSTSKIDSDNAARRAFVIVIKKIGGMEEVRPMRTWLREHPEHIPNCIDQNNFAKIHSHSLRDALISVGWTAEETPFEVRLSPIAGELS